MDNDKDTVDIDVTMDDEQGAEGDQSTPEQRAANDRAAKQRLKDKLASQATKIAELESKLATDNNKGGSVPDNDRVAQLELKLARKDAQVEYGLDKESLVLLTGRTPEEIDAQAKYLATLLSKEEKASDNTDNPGDSTGTTDDNTGSPARQGDQPVSNPNLPTYQGKDDTDRALTNVSAALKKQAGL